MPRDATQRRLVSRSDRPPQVPTSVSRDCQPPKRWFTLPLRAAAKKIVQLPGGHKPMRHLHVQGSGYVMKREVLREVGLLDGKESYTGYSNRVAASIWEIGWYSVSARGTHGRRALAALSSQNQRGVPCTPASWGNPDGGLSRSMNGKQ